MEQGRDCPLLAFSYLLGADRIGVQFFGESPAGSCTCVGYNHFRVILGRIFGRVYIILLCLT